MMNLLEFGIPLGITTLVLLYGLFSLISPRLRARLSVWRLFYRFACGVRRKPAKPACRFHIVWRRLVGMLCTAIAVVWLTQLDLEVRYLATPFYVPEENRWVALEPDGSSAEAAVLERLNRVTEAALKPYGSIGLVVTAVDGDRTYVLQAGKERLGGPDAPGMDSVFEIGSITKVFTCTVLASLLENGTVSLDEPVSHLLPDGWVVPEYEGSAITVADLATHYSGLPCVPESFAEGELMDLLLMNPFDDPYRNVSEEYIRKDLAEYRLTRKPGTVHDYSNYGMGLLGLALAKRGQQSYESLVLQTVCEPLGMVDTAIGLNPVQSARLAQGYAGHFVFGRVCLTAPGGRWSFHEVMQGCGALCSTPRDMLKFLRANIVAPEGPIGSLLARVQETARNDIDAEDVKDVPDWFLEYTGASRDCAIGLALFNQSLKGLDAPIYWHNGGTGGYSSYMAFSKKDKTGVIVLVNEGSYPLTLGQKILQALHEGK